MTWFDSQHCKSRAHCTTCRAQTSSGERFRQRLCRAYADVLPRDFLCPYGMPWGTVTPLAEVQFDTPWNRAREAVFGLTGEAGVILRDELRMLDAWLSLHSWRSPCWQSRQRRRFVEMVATATARFP